MKCVSGDAAWRPKCETTKSSRCEDLPGHPLNDGRSVRVARADLGALYDPDRLRSPLQRVRERGSDSFRTADWDTALGHGRVCS